MKKWIDFLRNLEMKFRNGMERLVFSDDDSEELPISEESLNFIASIKKYYQFFLIMSVAPIAAAPYILNLLYSNNILAFIVPIFLVGYLQCVVALYFNFYVFHRAMWEERNFLLYLSREESTRPTHAQIHIDPVTKAGRAFTEQAVFGGYLLIVVATIIALAALSAESDQIDNEITSSDVGHITHPSSAH